MGFGVAISPEALNSPVQKITLHNGTLHFQQWDIVFDLIIWRWKFFFFSFLVLLTFFPVTTLTVMYNVMPLIIVVIAFISWFLLYCFIVIFGNKYLKCTIKFVAIEITKLVDGKLFGFRYIIFYIIKLAQQYCFW